MGLWLVWIEGVGFMCFNDSEIVLVMWGCE